MLFSALVLSNLLVASRCRAQVIVSHDFTPAAPSGDVAGYASFVHPGYATPSMYKQIDWNNPVSESALNNGLKAWYLFYPGAVSGSLEWRAVYGDTTAAFQGMNEADFVRSHRPGGFGWTMNCAAFSKWIDMGDNPIYDRNRGFSFSIWMYWTNDSGWDALVHNGSQGFALYLEGGTNTLSWRKDQAFEIISSSFDPAQDTWYHVVITVESGATSSNVTHTMYVDGQLELSSTNNGDFGDNAGLNICAGRDTGTDIANIRVDSFRFYHRELSAAEVANLYIEEKLGYPTTLNYMSR